jgi:hypothetical protein
LYCKALWTTEIASLPEMYNILKISETVGSVDHNCNVMVYAIHIFVLCSGCEVSLPDAMQQNDGDSIAFPTFTPHLFFFILLPP